MAATGTTESQTMAQVVYVPVPSFVNAAVPPHCMVSPWKAGPTNCVLLATASRAEITKHATWKERPSAQNAPFHRGEGKMMMMMMMMVMMMCVTLVCFCVFTVRRTVHSTGGKGKRMLVMMCVLTLTLVCPCAFYNSVQNAPFHRGGDDDDDDDGVCVTERSIPQGGRGR